MSTQLIVLNYVIKCGYVFRPIIRSSHATGAHKTKNATANFIMCFVTRLHTKQTPLFTTIVTNYEGKFYIKCIYT